MLLDTMCFIYVGEQVPPYLALLQPVLGGIASGEVKCSISVNDRAWQRATECAVVVLQDAVAAP